MIGTFNFAESKPFCGVRHHHDSRDIEFECDASYKGKLIPELELKLQTQNPNPNPKPNGRLIRKLTLDTVDPLRSLNLSCVVSFSENSTKNARLTPENENNVIGTVAGNTPSLVSSTECPSPPIITCKSQI